ncbi:MAG: GNAT family N-acetyltransferase [Alphaproteobacteria bacterium]|nr:GNAT family N-acetyltransferase [Alphaproteobacteria bacterium]
MGFRPADGVRLSSEPGWNQIEDDWAFMVGHGDSFGMVAPDGRPVASGVTVPFDSTYGWISMILVMAAYRRRGLATHMMYRCIDALRRRGLTPALDATPAGRQVYVRLGFRDVYTLTRYLVPAGRAAQLRAAPATLRSVTEADLDRLVAYDRAPFGAGRGFMLRHLWSRLPEAAVIAERDGCIQGFVLGRKGRVCDQIGPLVADDDATAMALLDAALAKVSGAVCLDLGDHHGALRFRLQELGATTLVPFIRMIEGRSEPFDDPKRIFAIAGPELA